MAISSKTLWLENYNHDSDNDYDCDYDHDYDHENDYDNGHLHYNPSSKLKSSTVQWLPHLVLQPAISPLPHLVNLQANNKYIVCACIYFQEYIYKTTI